eukprot:7389518-Karenia_brevis.AAC.1
MPEDSISAVGQTRLPPKPDRPPPMPFGVQQEQLAPPPGLSTTAGNLPAEFVTDAGPAKLPVTLPSEYHTVVPDLRGAAASEPPAPGQDALAPGGMNAREVIDALVPATSEVPTPGGLAAETESQVGIIENFLAPIEPAKDIP